MIDGRVDAKGMWAAVRQLTGRQQDTPQVDGVTAESLNEHYASTYSTHDISVLSLITSCLLHVVKVSA